MKMWVALLAAGIVAGFTVPSACAGTVVVAGNWDIVNRTGQNANDFHISAYSDSNLTFVSSVNGAFGTFGNGQSIYNPLVKNYDWTDGNVANGGKTHIGLELNQQSFNNVNIQEACWTKDGAKLQPCVALAGLKVTPAGGPGPARVELNIPGSDPVYMAGVSWEITPTEVALPSLTFQSGGLGNSVGDFTITSFFDIFTDLAIPDGEFLVIQGQAFADANHTTLLYDWELEHEHDVPEPAAAMLMLFGLVLLCAGARLRKHL